MIPIHFGIGKKLGLSFLAVIGLLLGLAILAFWRINGLSDEIQLMVEDRYPKTELAHSIKDELNEQARNMRNMLLMSDAGQLKKEYDHMDESSRTIARDLETLEKSITSAKGKEDLKLVYQSRRQFLEGRTRFLALSKAGKMDEAKAFLLNELRPVQLAYMNKMDELIALQSGLMKNAGHESEIQVKQTNQMVVGMALFATVVAAALALATTRSILQPIHEAMLVARRVADGDLRGEIRIHSNDEMGQLLHSLRDMNQSLNKIVNEVRIGTETIATASDQIAKGNMDLSSRTEQQASSLEETASSMEELTSTVKQNGDNARQANQLALSASDAASKGGEVVSRVVQTMREINESSHKVVDIISVIDGIAFQTNILALNAAVEAARAGEQGRGFAVVASEVRNLAQRSAAAAKEINQLINNSVEKVNSGSKLVDEAGATMQIIVQGIRNVADIMGEITAASAEQTMGIEQINQAIVQMDEVTQQNAALVEQAAAAAASMQDKAAGLVEVVSVFNIAPQNTAANRPPEPGAKTLALSAS